jgi:hypothetical protein
MVVHLLGSAGLHAYLLVAGTHAPLAVFPPWYSGLAIAYFGAFAARGWTMRLRPVP